MACIGFSRNVKVEIFILGELFKKEDKESINILTSGNCVGHRLGAVTVTNVDGLIQEDH